MAYSRGSGKNCAIVNCRNNYKKFCQVWANRSICSYSDFNLAYVAEFQCKTGYAKKNKKNGRYGNPQHTFFFTNIPLYFVQKN